MPVLPSEDNAPAGLTEKIAKDPSSNTESTASEHEGHANEHNPLGNIPSASTSCRSHLSVLLHTFHTPLLQMEERIEQVKDNPTRIIRKDSLEQIENTLLMLSYGI